METVPYHCQFVVLRSKQCRLWLMRPMREWQSLPHEEQMRRSQLLFSLFAWPFFRWLRWWSSLHLPSVAYGGAVCRNVLPALGVNFQGFHISFAHVLVPQLWAATGSFANGKFSIEDGLRYSAILHAAYMANPAQTEEWCWCYQTPFASAGVKAASLKTWKMPKSSPCIRTKGTGATVTTTEASLSWALWAKCTLMSCSRASSNWLNVSFLNPNAVSAQNAQQWTWFSPFANSRRNAGNNRNPSTLPSVT